jgi:tripartite-type tricarboxylate transporter receptor subunit TctC
VADLVAAAKASPGDLKFAFVGAGSGAYFAAERFAAAAGLNVQPVAYPSPVKPLTLSRQDAPISISCRCRRCSR